MTSKDKTVKIKAKYDDRAPSGYNKGDVFQAILKDGFYYFMDNDGQDRYRPEEDFTIIPDEPTIEVGSEWVDHKGAVLTVDHVGNHLLICTWNESGREFASSIKNHLKFYKPKPKTVTMYFYRQHTERLFASEFPPNFTETLFTREIELP